MVFFCLAVEYDCLENGLRTLKAVRNCHRAFYILYLLHQRKHDIFVTKYRIIKHIWHTSPLVFQDTTQSASVKLYKSVDDNQLVIRTNFTEDLESVSFTLLWHRVHGRKLSSDSDRYIALWRNIPGSTQSGKNCNRFRVTFDGIYVLWMLNYPTIYSSSKPKRWIRGIIFFFVNSYWTETFDATLW